MLLLLILPIIQQQQSFVPRIMLLQEYIFLKGEYPKNPFMASEFTLTAFWRQLFHYFDQNNWYKSHKDINLLICQIGPTFSPKKFKAQNKGCDSLTCNYKLVSYSIVKSHNPPTPYCLCSRLLSSGTVRDVHSWNAVAYFCERYKLSDILWQYSTDKSNLSSR